MAKEDGALQCVAGSCGESQCVAVCFSVTRLECGYMKLLGEYGYMHVHKYRLRETSTDTGNMEGSFCNIVQMWAPKFAIHIFGNIEGDTYICVYVYI